MATFDSRTIGDSDVLAWHELLADVPFSDADAVVKAHYATSGERIMPVHVLEGVKKLRTSRLERADATFEPDCDPDDTAEYMRRLRQHRTQIAEGGQDPKGLSLMERADIPAESTRQLGNVFRRLP